MADQDDENEFSDGGLDGLPQSTLQELEDKAISSTQHHVTAQRLRQHTRVTKPYKLSIPSNPKQEPLLPPNPPSSDYGLDDDEDVVDLDESSRVLQPSYAPAQHGNVSHTHALDTSIDTLQDNEYGELHDPMDLAPAHEPYSAYPTNQHGYATSRGLDLKHFEARIKKLERELEAAKEAERRKAGEIAIVRSKHQKDTNEYERRLAVIQKLHIEEASKQKAEIEAARKEREVFATDKRFLEHDLAQELERNKRLKLTAHEGATNKRHGQQNSTIVTPKKPYDIPFRDGFDDHEIAVVSPSKPKEKPRPDTPKAGEKRKRNNNHNHNISPARSLQLDTFVAAPSPSPTETEQGDVEPVLPEWTDMTATQLKTIQHVLNHRPPDNRNRTIELLTRHSFPSDPQKTVAGLFLEEFSRYSLMSESMTLPAFVCKVLAGLWATSLKDKFYGPVELITDLLEFVLASGPRCTSNALITRLVPLAIKTIDLIAVPLARPSESAAISGADSSELKMVSKLSDEINIDHVLSILHEVAMTASLTPDSNRLFWQEMEFDFTLMMLNVPQQLPHIQLVLQMVAASVLPDSFGVIATQAEKQTGFETYTIDRLTNLLFEQPKAPPEEDLYDDVEVMSLRLDVIRTLSAIAATEHGGSIIAQRRNAIGRLIRFLHIQTTALYDVPATSFGMMEEELTVGPSTARQLTTNLINMTVRLIYHLMHHHADVINIREKLADVAGWHQKFLVSFTRIAFTEQLVLEAGVEEEVVDAAHEILDSVLFPEEGEAIVEAIETPRATTSTRGSAPG